MARPDHHIGPRRGQRSSVCTRAGPARSVSASPNAESGVSSLTRAQVVRMSIHTSRPDLRRRRWTTADKLRIVVETYEPGVSIGRVARRNGIDHHLLRRWRRLLSRGTLGEAGAERHCMVCNEPFEAARPDAKFCSSKCRQKAYRLQKASAPERS